MILTKLGASRSMVKALLAELGKIDLFPATSILYALKVSDWPWANPLISFQIKLESTFIIATFVGLLYSFDVIE